MELPRDVAVVGAGTMGAGIARVFAEAGCSVRLCARRASSLEAARPRLGSHPVKLTISAKDALTGADLVVETIEEAVEPKRGLFTLSEEVAAPKAILTTNTSSLPLDSLAAGLARPERFAGLHWLSPPELVEVVEVVGGTQTAPETIEKLCAWVEALGKAPVVVRRDVRGFVTNRLQYALLREAYALVDAGVCSPADVDRAVTRGLGARWAAIGPFESMDLAGLDVHAAVAANLYPELASDRKPSATLGRALATGALGVKNGRGIRGDYEPADVAELVDRRDRVLRGIAALREGKETTG